MEKTRYEQCILATCCIPWNEYDIFMEDVFRNQLKSILNEGTKHIYIFGTAGEGYAVSDSQFKEITSVFFDEMQKGNGSPMVGIISLSLNTIVDRIRWCRDQGIKEFMITLPGWSVCTPGETRAFFNETVAAFPDCLFFHYNNPRSKRLINADEYRALSEEFPNLAATKNGSDSLSEVYSLMKNVPHLRHFFTESAFMAACLLGYQPGFLATISSIKWQTANSFFRDGTDKNIMEMRQFYSEYMGIRKLLMDLMGRGTYVDGAYDKFYAKMNDPDFPLKLLKPYRYAQDETFNEFRKRLAEGYPNWIS